MSDHPTSHHPSQLDATEPAPLPVGPPRYEFLSEIARGAMGTIYRARDTALNRDIAIKVLHPRFRLDSAPARRFVEEGQITSQLQHPGIPAVHDLGTLADGRPFLAMKLIRGGTLDDLLKARPDPTHDRGRFIATFEQICQALGYAHAYQVIHRDLKPANIMVGAFGEVQVMDWGLAKVMASSASDGRRVTDPELTAALSEIDSDREHASATRAGSVLGTPAYMPPEQAIGAIDQIDQRSDVFGLGAILCAILTGKPPYLGADSESTRQLAARAKLDDALVRLDGCGAEPELVALCKRCLSVEKSARPADAGEMAGAVAALRAAADDRARQAELDRVKAEGAKAAAEARAEEVVKTRRVAEEKAIERRKRRRVQLALAAAVGLILLGGGAFAWWQQKHMAERDTERRLTESANLQAAESALDLAEAAIRNDNPVYGGIDAALDQAARRVAAGGADDLRDRLAAALAARRMLELLDQLADLRWMLTEGHVPSWTVARDAYRTAFQEYGLDLTADTTEVLAAKVRQSLIAGVIQTALDDWLAVLVDLQPADVAVDPKLIDLLVALDPDPERTAIRRTIANRDTATLSTWTARLNGRALPPSFAKLVGDNWSVPLNLRLEILRQAQVANPSHFGLATSAGYVLRIPTAERSDYEEALGYYRVAVALRPRNPQAYAGLGDTLYTKQDFGGAVTAYKEAIRLDPKHHFFHIRMGYVLERTGDFDGAITAYKEAIRLDPKFAPSHSRLGNLLVEKGDFDRAIVEYQEIIRLDPKSDHALAKLPHVERMRELLPRLPDIVAGRTKPASPAEACVFAWLCARPPQGRYAAAVRLYTSAFASDPKLLNEYVSYRYDAACYAARAARGDGADAPADAGERAALRGQAFAWLRSELALRKKQATSANADGRKWAADILSHWLTDSDLSGVRPPFLPDALPGYEAKKWLPFWVEVRATRDELLKPVPTPEVAPPPREQR